ncbi:MULTISPECIES: ABC transporter ATP-binding protein [Bacillus cereus group]|uniref:ABC transporter ATP-binding protein n=1 Tax=Bacillus cereus group TaxID=86661 RepID=UPI000CD8F7B4|nr:MULTISPECIES: ABC transporter ATP-binding protein [Bacillus cereus group]QFQ28973.1 ABC transporter ATP-binding protein [Bacillus thuringiensis]
MEYIRLENVNKGFGNNELILKNINLTFTAGERVGIVGSIGSGKTTLLRVIMGIYRPTSGEVVHYINKNQIGYLPASKGVTDELTVLGNLMFWAKAYNKSIEAVKEVVSNLKMESMVEKKASQLSSGMKQKLAFACAIIHKPKLLILDEPTVNLDVENRILLKNIIKNYLPESCIIITSHNFDDIENLCERILLISEGEIKIQKQLETLKTEYKSSKVHIRLLEDMSEKQRLKIQQTFDQSVINKNEIVIDRDTYNLNAVLLILIQLRINIRDVVESDVMLEEIYLNINKKEG